MEETKFAFYPTNKSSRAVNTSHDYCLQQSSSYMCRWIHTSVSTLCFSMSTLTVSRSPRVGWSSARYCSAFANQSSRFCTASVSWPDVNAPATPSSSAPFYQPHQHSRTSHGHVAATYWQRRARISLPHTTCPSVTQGYGHFGHKPHNPRKTM